MSNHSVILFGVGLTAGAIGFFVGYRVAEKRLSSQFDDRLEKETKGMREFYSTTKKPYATPQEAAADLIVTNEEAPKPEVTAYHKIVMKEGYDPLKSENSPETVIDLGETVERNIFEEKSDPENPYVITQEEFMENTPEWEQVNLTYYAGDNVVTDEREDVVDNWQMVIGKDAVTSFGMNSSDPDVVHVRNEKLRMDIEVILHEGTYRQSVLGIEEDMPDLPSGRNRDEL